MLISNILRKPFRKVLKNLTIKVLDKHNPRIVAVLGDGQTSIVRETAYHILKDIFPVRRNLEAPEAEFSVPLTILGYSKYPKNYIEWLEVILITYFSIKRIKPYNHVLVLELNAVDEQILNYWVEITKPEAAIIVGNTNLKYDSTTFKKIIKISSTNSGDILATSKIAVKQLGRYFRIDQTEIDNNLENLQLPKSKIRILKGKNQSLIIDATHYYLPVKIESAVEMTSDEDERKVIFTNDKNDIKYIKESNNNSKWLINPKNYKPTNNDIILIRGERTKSYKLIQKYKK